MKRYNFKEDTVLQSNLLAGEASADEVQALELWREHDVINNDFWLNLEELMGLERAAIVGLEVDSEMGWKKISAGIALAEKNRQSGDRRTVSLSRRIIAYSAIAASIIGIIFLSINLFRPANSIEIAVLTSKIEVKEVLLADGSEVTINGGSRFAHPAEFDNNQRVVSLNGEAFFKVAKNKAKPFIVKTNGLQVKVVGTEFNVRDFGVNSKLLEVTVVEGVVEVEAIKELQAKVTLTKGQSVVLNTDTHTFTKNSVADLNAVGWKTKVFEFKNAKLSDVFELLSDAYKFDIKASNESVLTEQLTANFENRDINFIMKTISSTFNFTYSIENGVVMIN